MRSYSFRVAAYLVLTVLFLSGITSGTTVHAASSPALSRSAAIATTMWQTAPPVQDSGAETPDDTQTTLTRLSLFEGENNLRAAVIDAAGGFAYYGTCSSPGHIIKIRLADFTRVATLVLNPGEDCLQVGLIDPVAGFLYFGASGSVPGIVVKVRLADFTRVGSLTLNADEKGLFAGAIDPGGGFAYFAAYPGPGLGAKVVRVRLSDFSRVDALTLNAADGELAILAAAIDVMNGFLYVGLDMYTHPTRIIKINLQTFTRTATLALPTEGGRTRALIVDNIHNYLYVGPEATERVVRVALSTFTRVDALEFNHGEGNMMTGVLDATSSYLYVNSGGYPQDRIIKIRLADFTRAGSLQLQTGDSFLNAAVIDPEHGYAYFATDTRPAGKVIRLALQSSDRPLYLPLVLR